MKLLSCGLLLMGLSVGLADPPVDTSYLPPAVQRTIREYQGEGDLKKVKTKRENGRTYYEVEYKERGDEKELVVAEDGTVLSEKGKREGKEGKDEKRERKIDRESRQNGERSERVTTTPTPPPVVRSPRPSTQPPPPPVNPDAIQVMRFYDLPQPLQVAIRAEQQASGRFREVKRDVSGPQTLYHARFDKGTVSYNAEGQKVVRGQAKTRSWER